MDLATLDNLKQPLKEWHEVPMAKFLSWPHAMQLAYCAARDDDSALHASFEDEAIWYRKRAQSYRDELHHLI